MLVYQRVSWFSEKHLGKKTHENDKNEIPPRLDHGTKTEPPLPPAVPSTWLPCRTWDQSETQKKQGEIRSGFQKKSTIYEGNLHSDHETTVCFWFFGVPDVLKFNGKGCSFLLGTPKLPKISIDGKKTSRNPCVFFIPIQWLANDGMFIS